MRELTIEQATYLLTAFASFSAELEEEDFDDDFNYAASSTRYLTDTGLYSLSGKVVKGKFIVKLRVNESAEEEEKIRFNEFLKVYSDYLGKSVSKLEKRFSEVLKSLNLKSYNQLISDEDYGLGVPDGYNSLNFVLIGGKNSFLVLRNIARKYEDIFEV